MVTDQSTSYGAGNLKLNQDSPIVPFFKTICYPPEPLAIHIKKGFNNSTIISVEESLGIGLVRTVRLENKHDDKLFELPAGFGTLPLFNVEDFRGTLPIHMVEMGGLIVPMFGKLNFPITFLAKRFLL
jgi:hypothetical protein